MEDYPEFIGAWKEASLSSLEMIDTSKDPKYNAFFIFLESQIDKKGKLIFKGRGRDRFGKSKIEGTLTNLGIEFTKKYDREAIQKGGAKEILNYNGVRENYMDATNTLTSFYSGLITRENHLPINFIMQSFFDQTPKVLK